MRKVIEVAVKSQKEDLPSLLNILSHSGSVDILRCLKKGPKRQIELIKETGLDKTIVWRRTKELGLAGLIKMEITITDRHPKFELTPTGRRILELLEEIERVYKEGVSLEEKELKEIEKMLKER